MTILGSQTKEWRQRSKSESEYRVYLYTRLPRVTWTKIQKDGERLGIFSSLRSE